MWRNILLLYLSLIDTDFLNNGLLVPMIFIVWVDIINVHHRIDSFFCGICWFMWYANKIVFAKCFLGKSIFSEIVFLCSLVFIFDFIVYLVHCDLSQIFHYYHRCFFRFGLREVFFRRILQDKTHFLQYCRSDLHQIKGLYCR